MTPQLPEYPILLLGGAKRVSIARHIADAFRRRGLEARFISYEIDSRVPIAEIAEVVIGKRWSDPELYAHLADIVCTRGVRMIIPFVDGAVAPASDFAASHPGLRLFVPGSDAALSETMFDKVLADRLFRSLDLPVPASRDSGFPLIAKPRRGSASKGIVVLNSKADLEALPAPDNYLIQEYIPHREEISVDCYVSVTDGRILAVSPRRRIETLGGEAVRSITIDSPDAIVLSRRILSTTGLRGAVTIQLLRDLDRPSRLMIMEINPRLGGAVVCSIGAGADIPGAIADDALGRPSEPTEATPGTGMCRYFQEVIFKP